jgi:hypothetical protein
MERRYHMATMTIPLISPGCSSQVPPKTTGRTILETTSHLKNVVDLCTKGPEVVASAATTVSGYISTAATKQAFAISAKHGAATTVALWLKIAAWAKVIAWCAVGVLAVAVCVAAYKLAC